MRIIGHCIAEKSGKIARFQQQKSAISATKKRDFRTGIPLYRIDGPAFRAAI
jgi:hypothetical protein